MFQPVIVVRHSAEHCLGFFPALPPNGGFPEVEFRPRGNSANHKLIAA